MTAKTTSRVRVSNGKTKAQESPKRPRRAAGEPPAGPTPVPTDPADLHRRWEAARRIVHQAVGTEDEHDPRIWERGLYQLWLWLVVERLVVRRDEIDVGELSVISKMLYDQRKLSLDEAKQRQKTGDGAQGNGAAASTQLPEHFGELVRQIYGTNFQADGEAGRAPSE
jgi:hypothetical protein